MKKPYIICHMMISIDGRIDCAMTSKLPGVDDYYTSLDEITVPMHIAKLNGRICGAKRSHSVFEQPNCYQSV